MTKLHKLELLPWRLAVKSLKNLCKLQIIGQYLHPLRVLAELIQYLCVHFNQKDSGNPCILPFPGPPWE